MSRARPDPARLDLDVIVHMPLRRRSRGRAALNLLGLVLAACLFAYGVVRGGGAALAHLSGARP